MGLKVIGTGQGRTGTTSLKIALEQLGFGKCYHMWELMNNPDQLIYVIILSSGTINKYWKNTLMQKLFIQCVMLSHGLKVAVILFFGQ